MTLKRLRVLVAVVAVGFVLALVLGSAGLLGGGRALGSSTTITVIGGDVAVRHGASGAFVAAVDGEVLNAGDAVRTGAESRAVLTYFEGSTVTIEPNTQVSIDVATPQSGGSVVQMTQVLGRTWHVVTRLVDGNSKYEVKTPASTASVRGTAFTVATDGTTTTIESTEGTVLSEVPDPSNPGRTIEVPVGPGQQQSQRRGEGASSSESAPAPDRKVTITLSEQNTIVIDTLGRANGIDANGKVFRQTPGAKLEIVDGHLVITLPNIPDGRLQALVRKQGGGDVELETVVEEHGKSTTSSGHVNADASSGQGRANVDISTTSGGNAGGPKADQTQSPSPTPGSNATATATPTQTAGGGTGGGAGGGTSGGGQTGQGGQGGQGTNPPGQGQGGGGNPGQGQGGGRPTSTPGGFVPPSALPTLPSSTTASPSPSHPGNGGGPGGNTGGSGSQGGNSGGNGNSNSGGKKPSPNK